MMITADIQVSGETLPFGGIADTRTGTYMGHLVAVKTLRVAEQDDLLRIKKVNINNPPSATWDTVLTLFLQRFCKEVVLWNMLSHPHVLKLIGVRGNMDTGQFITVSEWMIHGNIVEYIRRNHTNRLELVRDFTISANSSTKNAANSCTGQLRVSITFTTPVSYMGTSKGSVTLRFVTGSSV